MEGTRLDKWLWAARFFKTRSLAQTAIENGRVLVGGDRVKVARELKVGDEVLIRISDSVRSVVVAELSEQRGPASVAQGLYVETEASIRERVARAAARAMGVEPSRTIVGRPTKRDRRDLEKWREA
jgi:ribosome-associated heat shock protein Hsp15